MELIGVAIEALAVVAAVALVSAQPQRSEAEAANQTIDCEEGKNTQRPVEVKQGGFTLLVKCPRDFEFQPTVTSKEVENVCTKSDCTETKALTAVCPHVSGEKEDQKVSFTFSALPDAKKTFYVRCHSSSYDCTVTVTVDAAPTPEGVPGGGSGSPALPTCDTGGNTITLSIPDKGSSAQFSCGTKFTLYPTALDKVFAENCKKQEDLKDIQRSASGTAVTLTATKKPPKKKLCFLCASPSVTHEKPGSASDYCIVYVESSARARFCSAAALTILLPSMMTVLSFA